MVSPSAAALGTAATWRDGRHGGNNLDRGRVNVVDVDKRLWKQTNMRQTVIVTEAILN